MEGVSFVVPVHNGARTIGDTLASIEAQRDGRPMEVIVVDDRSRDGSREILDALASCGAIRILDGDGRGAAAAINQGILAARLPIICQVDQDVALQPGWLEHLVSALDDRTVGAVQARYDAHPAATLSARAMNCDLEDRYAALVGRETDHVCTGNTAYRAAALHRVGLFDESLGYGYDNDLSYRLRAAGYRLAICRDARSLHHWREGIAGYLVQQYGFGYGRIDLVAKHPARIGGDAVSPWAMMLHAPAMALVVALLVIAAVWAAAGGPASPLAIAAGAIAAILVIERSVAGVRASIRFRTPVPLVFPVLHLLRDLAWTAAIAAWTLRRVAGRPSAPAHSMSGRPGAAS